MKKRFASVLLIIYCFVFIFTGCRADQDKNNNVETIPGVVFDEENPLDLKKIYIKMPKIKMALDSGGAPLIQLLQTEVVDEVNRILEEKINTVIDIEYIPYVNQQEEILKKLYANDQVDVIDYRLQDPENYMKDLNIADLTDLLPIYYPELFTPDIDSKGIYTNGRIYHLPKIYANAFQDRLCLHTEREFYDAAGRPSIKTLGDVMALYDFGLEHVNKEGVMFLDGKINRDFICPFSDFLKLYLQENGYVSLDVNNFFAVKDGEVFDLFENGMMESCYYYLADMYSKGALCDDYFFMVNWLPRAESIEPGVSMGLVSFSMNSFYQIKNPDEFSRLYTTMFIGDYEPYSYKMLSPGWIVCDNGNADRSIIAFRLMMENKQLNQLLTYGIKDVHYKYVDDNRIINLYREAEVAWEAPRSVYKWWTLIVNMNHYIPMVTDPEDADYYVRDLYERPKQVIPGVNNNKLRSYNSLVKADLELNDAMEQRNEIYRTLYSYEIIFKEGLPYNELIRNFNEEKQHALYQLIKDHINSLK